MNKNSFIKMSGNIEGSLEKGKITKNLIGDCRGAVNTLSRLEKKVMEKNDITQAIRLYSAVNTSKIIIENSIERLKESREKGENPTTLEELANVLFLASDLGLQTEEIVSTEEKDLRDLRSGTFKLQKTGEELGLLESIGEKINKIPEDIREDMCNSIEK